MTYPSPKCCLVQPLNKIYIGNLGILEYEVLPNKTFRIPPCKPHNFLKCINTGCHQ